MDTTVELISRAEDAFQARRYREAYPLFVRLAKQQPAQTHYRQRLADICVFLERPQDALRILKHVAAVCMQRGEIPQAISVSKRILEIDPNDNEMQQRLEELYAKAIDETDQSLDPHGAENAQWQANRQKAKAHVQALAFATLKVPTGELELAGPDDKVTLDIGEMAVSDFQPGGSPRVEDIPPAMPHSVMVGSQPEKKEMTISGFDGFNEVSITRETMDDISLQGIEPPGMFPKIPILSDLPPGAFSQMVQSFSRLQFPPKTQVVHQGDAGDSIYILTSGQVQVIREFKGERQVLAVLGPGNLFGEAAYFSKGQRGASVESLAVVEVLELTRQSVDELVLKYPKIERAMRKLYTERVLRNLLRDSPLFSSLAEADREKFLPKFQFAMVKPGQSIVKEGEVAKAFYVIQQGLVRVHRQNGSEALAELGPGEFFGEYAMITGAKRTASVTAVEPTHVVLLSREVFSELLKGRPEVIENLRQIAKARLAQ